MKPKQQYNRSWRKDHTDKGLCLDCNNKAEPGYLRCRKHLEQNAQIARKRRTGTHE
jgi:hypothetical protein